MANLKTLREKLRERRRQRKRQKTLSEKTHKRGHARAAAAAGRAIRRLSKLIRRFVSQHPSLALVKVHSTAPSGPHWGGGADIMGQFVTPFLRARGLVPGSGKRTPQHNAAIGGSPTSDHLTTNTLTFARDYPTFSGEDDARALAQAMGYSAWQPNSYATFNVTVDGHTFRVQILWGAAINHSDHIHVGIGLVA